MNQMVPDNTYVCERCGLIWKERPDADLEVIAGNCPRCAFPGTKIVYPFAPPEGLR